MNSLYVAGLDEVGRGCIAGPVLAAAVILPPEGGWKTQLTDSKKLTPAKREKLAGIIRSQAIAWALGRAEVDEIDHFNILEASMLAMRRAVQALAVRPDRALVDGNRYPLLDCPGEAIIGGDALIPEISAASILAKVARDYEMCVLERLFPGYGLDIHKGYPTRLHIERLQALGSSRMHRQSFKPVKSAMSCKTR